MFFVSCQWKAFTDDFKLCTYYKSDTSDFANCNKLLSDLDTVFAVCSSWNLKLNPEKYVSISFGRSIATVSCEYSLSVLLLKRVHTYMDLGVIDYKLRFH